MRGFARPCAWRGPGWSGGRQSCSMDRGANVAPGGSGRKVCGVAFLTVFRWRRFELAADLFEMEPATLQIRADGAQRAGSIWSPGAAGTVEQAALVCDAHDLACVVARKLERQYGVLTGRFDDARADWIVEASGRGSGNGIFGGREGRGYFAAHCRLAGPDATTRLQQPTRVGYIHRLLIPRAGLSVLMICTKRRTFGGYQPDGTRRLARACRGSPSPP